MLTEDYCNFEIAKLLKEKGFDEEIETLITPTGKIYFLDENSVEKTPHKTIRNTQINTYSNDVSCPTLQMTMKWLREVYHYYIQVMLDSWALGDHMGYYVVIQKTDSEFEMMLQDAVDEVFYETYEEAVEAAILFCLENLI